MKKVYAVWLPLLVMLGILSVVGFYACSGGGGGAADVSAEQRYGTVGILMADDPTDVYNHIWITLTDITLVPAQADGKEVVIFQSDGYKLDLLSLRDEDFLLTLHDRIPAGAYEKIRLGVSDIKTEGGPCDYLEVKLPSDKIDFEPEGGFVVEPDETIYLKLDIDANKSVNIHTAGNSGKCIFRPVVFVDIIKGEPICFWRHAFRGTIVAVLDTDLDGLTDGFVLERDNTCLGTLEVKLAEDTVIFNENGEFVGPEALAIDQDVTVRGVMDPEGFLWAKAVILGQTLVLKGSVDGEVMDAEGGYHTFSLQPDLGEEFVGPVKVIVYDQTLIRSGCDTQETLEDIIIGVQAVVAGKYDTQEEALKSVGILLLIGQ